MVMYREVCPEGVQNKCPGGVWCRGFMSWGDTLILVISRGVQLYYGIAQFLRKSRIIAGGIVQHFLHTCSVLVFHTNANGHMCLLPYNHYTIHA